MDSSRPVGAEAMTRRSLHKFRRSICAKWIPPLLAVVLVAAAHRGDAQTIPQAGPFERNYPQSKSVVEKALKELQPAMSGRLPVLDGFASPGDHPLNRYQRAYFQSAVQVSSTASGGSAVRVSTKVTAWYADSTPSRSGYQLLTSNGRLESDLLDQLTELLATTPGGTSLGGNSAESSSVAFPSVRSAVPPPAPSPNQPAVADNA